MAEFRHSEHGDDPGSIAEPFASEVELLRNAATLPALSRRLRSRVVGAAASAFQQARRWTQVRQAATFLTLCLGTSLVLSSLPPVPWPSATIAAQWRTWKLNGVPAITASREFSLSTSSAWALRDNQEFLGMRISAWANARDRRSTTVARTDPAPPADERIELPSASDGWAAVDAFQALRSGGQHTRLRTLWAN